MLAYVFWHRADPSVAVEAYEAELRTFHDKLASARPPGLLRSVAFRVVGVTWLDGDGPCFEDWYLLDRSAALDQLNDAAVGPTCVVAHDTVAARSQAGTAGLYRLRAGTEAGGTAVTARWFDKPAGVPSAEVPRLVVDGDLWGRMMTLGPTPEFCLLDGTTEAVTDPVVVTRKLV
jgi:hypothetical protein